MPTSRKEASPTQTGAQTGLAYVWGGRGAVGDDAVIRAGGEWWVLVRFMVWDWRVGLAPALGREVLWLVLSKRPFD